MDKRYTNFADMFDGGGAGATGSKFEGGGILSMIANMLATPRGSEDRQPTAQDRPMMRPQMAPQAAPQMAPPPSGLATEPNYADRFELPPQYSGRGSVGMPYPDWASGDPKMMELVDYLRSRGDYGMPAQGPNYADRFALPEQPQYSGRGSVGMPYPDWASGDPKMMELVDYLRSRGVGGY